VPPEPPQVVIVGAGAAGLAALRELDRAGCSVLCLEARNRIGGRIYTRHDPLLPVPVELGAEFVHGQSREIWDAVDAANLTAYDIVGRAVHIENGLARDRGDAWEQIGRVMEDMEQAAQSGEDKTFLEFIQHAAYPEETKRLASSYVEGFNAARKEVIGIASLASDARAADQIGGDRSFRIWNGYESVPVYLLHSIENWRAKLRLNTVVNRIQWKRGSVALSVRSRYGDNVETIRAGSAIVTVPLGVLQAGPDADGGIRFDPEPADTLAAANQLAFGQVVRVVLRFREAVWLQNEDFAGAGFLLSDETRFPAWWTTLPVRASALTGWSSGPSSDDLLGKPEREIVTEAIAALARMLGVSRHRLEDLLEQVHYHDWYSDPFSKGAYSYAPAGALHARDALAEPVESTLFFAGEAAETEGHSATVHGAIASGKRAARQVLESLT
jgi:monoamine oxidase